MSACEVPGCAEAKGRNRPVCSTHWARVPFSMQQAWWRQYAHGDPVTVGWLRAAVIGYGVHTDLTDLQAEPAEPGRAGRGEAG